MGDQPDDQLLRALSRAVDDHRLHMLYQPKVKLPEGSLVGVEALLRWDDPELGSIEPSRFIPIAERHGLIDELTCGDCGIFSGNGSNGAIRNRYGNCLQHLGAQPPASRFP